MRKIMMCTIAAMTVLALAACTPKEKNMTPAGPGPAPVPVQETETQVFEKTHDPNAPVMEMAFIYYGNSDATGLERETADLEELTAQALADLLIEHEVLEEGTTVNSFEMTGAEKAGPGVESGTEDGERIGILDLSAIPESGTSGEIVMLAAIGNTFTENFELDKLKLLINGENYSSGHIEHGDEDYLEYIDDYETFNK